jgi:hypothetical protein
MNLEKWYENRKCPHCLGKAHKTYAEGLECCKTQFEISNRAWKVAESIEHTKQVIEENLPEIEDEKT